MAKTIGEAFCITCSKEKSAVRCEGCLQIFCFDHLIDHRQALGKQLDEIEVNRDIFHQTLTEQTNDPQKQSLIRQIDQWERESIKKIQQTAEEMRQLILKDVAGYNARIEVKLNRLTDRIRQIRQENNFNETNLTQFKEQLSQLTVALDKPSNISIRENSATLIAKISLEKPAPLRSTNITTNAKWIQNGITIIGDVAYGNKLNQTYHPYGICADNDQTIYITDYENDCIIEWKYGASREQVVAGGNGQGNNFNQLNHPTDVIIDKDNDYLIISDSENGRVVLWPRYNGKNGEVIISNVDCCGLAIDNEGYLYVSDCEKHEIKRWRIGDSSGTIVAGGNGIGNRLDQLNSPSYIFVDEEQSLYVSDTNNHRVMKWMKGKKEGIIVAGGQGSGDSLKQLSNPNGVIVDQLGTIYVADSSNNRIMRWIKGAIQGSVVVGGNGQGGEPNQLYWPIGLSFDQQGNLYVTEWRNNRVQRFTIDLSISS